MSKEVGEMVRSRDVVQAEGSARTEGALAHSRGRTTGVRADGAAAGAGSLAPGQRWSASRKRDVVLRLLRGESLEALSREAGVEIYRLEAWRERAMAGLELGLKDRHGEPVAEVLNAAKRHIGELSMGKCCNFESGDGSRFGIEVSCSHLEQPVDELNLAPHIRAAHPPRLPLPNHVHGLVSLDCSPRRVKLAKPLLGLYPEVDPILWTGVRHS